MINQNVKACSDVRRLCLISIILSYDCTILLRGTVELDTLKMPLRHATAEAVTRGLDLTNKVVLITGITSGIGKEAARVFALRNATVLGTGRTLEACKDSCLDIGERGVPFQCELSDPASVRGFVQNIRKRGQQLDVIVANA